MNFTQAYIDGLTEYLNDGEIDVSQTEIENATEHLHKVLWLAQLGDKTAASMIVKAARHIGGKV